MSYFSRVLQSLARDPSNRTWFFIPYDQLSDGFGPLARENPQDVGIILVECPWKAARRPYHKQKLALILSNMRHFALEQARRGVAVRYVVSKGSYKTAIEELLPELGVIKVMRPAERELRLDLEPLVKKGAIKYLPHEGWLTTTEEFLAGTSPEPPWRMDGFYRMVRREKDILMDGSKPLGGKYSFDAENRRPWPGTPPAPQPPRFEIDPIKKEVEELIRDRFAHHPGRLDLSTLPGTKEDAARLWSWARTECLPRFGPFEDAMSTASTNLFHTRLSMLLNIHRLLPRDILAEALALDLPLASREGFVRQIVGWREFVRHVHEATDGFNRTPGMDVANDRKPGDGSYATWSGRAWPRFEGPELVGGGAAPNVFGGRNPLPSAWWGEKSGLTCLDRVVADVWREAWSHHITRLMVLGNIATLLDVNPRELCDWFWVAYADAYDWVVEPNVLGMAAFAAGDLMTTKPYISGAGYVNRMSDYCPACVFNPRKNCPLTRLYWAFLARHYHVLAKIPRLKPVLVSLARRDKKKREQDVKVFDQLWSFLSRGEAAAPAAIDI